MGKLAQVHVHDSPQGRLISVLIPDPAQSVLGKQYSPTQAKFMVHASENSHAQVTRGASHEFQSGFAYF